MFDDKLSTSFYTQFENFSLQTKPLKEVQPSDNFPHFSRDLNRGQFKLLK